MQPLKPLLREIMDGFGRPRHNGNHPEETPGSRPNGLLAGRAHSTKVAILGDYHDTVRTLACFRRRDGYAVPRGANSMKPIIRVAQFANRVLGHSGAPPKVASLVSVALGP